MGKIPSDYEACQVFNCGVQPPATIIESECATDGTWAISTMCDRHAEAVLPGGTLMGCERCREPMGFLDVRPWSADDEMLLRLGRAES